jgi:YgiT-type zinc finger domain-containing protein
MKSESPEASVPCTECLAGHLQRKSLTYFTWLNDELITVTDFPAWICDMCGRREYDLHALNQLNLLLNPAAGKSTPKARPVSRKSDSKSSRPSRTE